MVDREELYKARDAMSDNQLELYEHLLWDHSQNDSLLPFQSHEEMRDRHRMAHSNHDHSTLEEEDLC